MRNIAFILAAILIFLTTNISHAQESEIFFEGIPVKVIYSGFDVNKENMLSAKQKDKSRVLITKRGKNYFWASREDKQLFTAVSGEFLYFIAMEGSGYIKIFPAENKYFEHMSIGLQTFTYWGDVLKLDLK